MPIPQEIRLFAYMTWALRGLAFKLRGSYPNGQHCDIENPSNVGAPDTHWIELASENDIRRWAGDKRITCNAIYDYRGQPTTGGLFDPDIFGRRPGMSAPMSYIQLATPIPHPWFINRDPGLFLTIMESEHPRVMEFREVAGTWSDYASEVRLNNQWRIQALPNVEVLNKNFCDLEPEDLFLSMLPVLPIICRLPDRNDQGEITGVGRINEAYLNVMNKNHISTLPNYAAEPLGIIRNGAIDNLYKSTRVSGYKSNKLNWL